MILLDLAIFWVKYSSCDGWIAAEKADKVYLRNYSEPKNFGYHCLILSHNIFFLFSAIIF